ncbi:MAG: response regulator [Lentisphaerota bacterium]
MRDGKKVILCVDDDQDMLDSLRIILEKNNYIMVEAPSAEKGFVRYKENAPDAIIVDMMMEEVDSGVHLAKELKFIDNKSPIFMLSSAGDNLNETIDYNELGLSGVLQKPFNPDHIIKLLKSKLHSV